MYELIILSLLAQWPLHGYLIAKIASDMAGPYIRISSGRLYPLLARMEEQGLIAAAEAAETPAAHGQRRRQKRYAITGEGRLRFHALMMDTTSNPGDYQRIFWYKVPLLYLLTLPERLYLLDHYMTYCQTHIFHFMNEIADMRGGHETFKQAPAIAGESVLFVMEHVLAHWRQELASAQTWRARVVEDAEGLPGGTDGAAGAPGATSATSETRGEPTR